MHPLSPNLDESARLAAVRRYLDTPPHRGFDRLTELAAGRFSVASAAISIVDADRVWFKSIHGLDIREMPREPGLCASAILSDVPTVIPDARLDAHACSHSWIAGSAGVRFYAAAPLRNADGFNLGTLCVMDTSPRAFSADDVKALETMAAVVMDQLELRSAAHRHDQSEAALRDSMERVIAERTGPLAALSRELIKSMEDERRKLAGELHDDMGGTLTLLSLKLQELGKDIGESSGGQMALQKEAMRMLREIIATQRRIVEGLRPLALDMFGLTTAIRNYVADWTRKSGVAGKVHVASDFPVLDADRSLALYRVMQESMTNIAKYAHAGKADLSLTRERDCVFITIEDDGIGMTRNAQAPASSHGIVGMRQRLLAFGGELVVEPGPAGRGTRIVGSVPLTHATSVGAAPAEARSTPSGLDT